jgi:hypothetical protein
MVRPPRNALLRRSAAVVLIACVLAPSPAVAEAVHTDDGEGDVWQAVYDDHDVLSGWEMAGSPGNADIVAADARHGARRIVFTTHYASLERGPGQNRFITQQRMVFDHGPGATVEVHTSLGWRGRAFLFSSRTGNRMPCDGIRHVIDYDADSVRVSFPRACVDRPRWLRYAGGGYALSGSATESSADDHNYFDNALNASHRRRMGVANTSDQIPRG